MADLAQYSIDELQTELDRRFEKLAAQHRDTYRRKVRRWCDNCVHFIAWADTPAAYKRQPETYNPCEKHHTMKFRMPDESLGPHPPVDTWGFYLPKCPDFKKKPSAPSLEESLEDRHAAAARAARRERENNADLPRTTTPQAPDPKGAK